MNPVKTYHAIDANNEQASFAISRMEDHYQKHGGKTNEPHRHDYFTVLVVMRANGIHKVDFNTYALGESQIYFVSPGQVHQIIEHQASVGFVMTFSIQFLIENAIDLSFIEGLNLFHDYGQSPPLVPVKEQFDRIMHFANEIHQLFQGNAHMKNLSIGAFLKLLLIECNNICSHNPITVHSETSENHLLQQFKKLVNEHYQKEHATSHYAGLLHITPDHLNRVIKSAIGKTAKEYIQSRIIIEAKRLLYFSKVSNKEIAYELGFAEPANFSAFFKKCTGLSPKAFQQRELVGQ